MSVATVAPLRQQRALLTDSCISPPLRTHRSAPRPASRQRSQKQASSPRACLLPTSQVGRTIYDASAPNARLYANPPDPHARAQKQHYARRNRSRRHIITAWRTIARRRTSTNEGSSSARLCAQASERRSVSRCSSRCVQSDKTDEARSSYLLRFSASAGITGSAAAVLATASSIPVATGTQVCESSPFPRPESHLGPSLGSILRGRHFSDCCCPMRRAKQNKKTTAAAASQFSTFLSDISAVVGSTPVTSAYNTPSATSAAGAAAATTSAGASSRAAGAAAAASSGQTSVSRVALK